MRQRRMKLGNVEEQEKNNGKELNTPLFADVMPPSPR